MNAAKLPIEHREALAKLVQAEAELKKLGFCIVRQAAIYIDARNAHFSTVIHTTKDEEDHAILDAVRDIMVEWSNSKHKSKLKWR